MKHLFHAVLATLILSSLVVADDEPLSPERQQEIIEDFMYVTGQRATPSASLADQLEEAGNIPLKCGTPQILAFLRNYDRLDPRLVASMGVQTVSRPQSSLSYDSPDGYFRIHYEVVGADAVYRADVDDNFNDVPDYVERVASIADSVYIYMRDTLGYPRPEPDTACVDGGDLKFDLYLKNFAQPVFGLTWADTACATNIQFVPGWMEIDNDYQEAAFAQYNENPLDAVRVTIAHEFFHMVHFSMDFGEARPLYEMSAVWMEEEQYDEINDYYSLLPFFYAVPRRSLQSELDLHHYSCGIFMLYLTENYGRDIIRDIWERSANLGIGNDWLTAIHESVIAASDSAAGIVESLRDFAVWNYFTGPYAHQAPNGIGFEEAEFYPAIPLARMARHESIDTTVLANNNTFNPEINAPSYVRFENLTTTFYPMKWQCDSGSFGTTCYDSSQYLDDTLVINLFVDLVPNNWGLSLIYQLAADPDSHEVETGFLPGQATVQLRTHNPRQYESITVVVTPTSTDPTIFFASAIRPFGYLVSDSNQIPPPEEAFVNLPAENLVPYPNPAVVPEMEAAGNSGINFRYQVPTDANADLLHDVVRYQVDLYTVSGEHVNMIQVDQQGQQLEREVGPPDVVYELQWDMRNDAGKEVASGVYVAFARLFSVGLGGGQLMEDRVKVVVIR